mmetsp:Transcript_5750/g.8480  ORF Transcript_5750/g.8480 Transcript_5750/m.8480 type:complete len:456 (+) Transcript_5750:55-1422(+)
MIDDNATRIMKVLILVRIGNCLYDVDKERRWCNSWQDNTYVINESSPSWIQSYRGEGGELLIQLDAWGLGNTMMEINDSLIFAFLLDLKPVFVLTDEAISSWRGGLYTVFDLMNGAKEERIGQRTNMPQLKRLDSETAIFGLVLDTLRRNSNHYNEEKGRRRPAEEKLLLQAPDKLTTYEKLNIELFQSLRNTSQFIATILDADIPPCWTIFFLRPSQHVVAKARERSALISIHLRTCNPSTFHDAPKCDRRAHHDPYLAAQRLVACIHLNETCLFIASDDAPLVRKIQNATPCAHSFDDVGIVLHPARDVHTFSHSKDAHLRLILDFVAFALSPNLMLSLTPSTFSKSSQNLLNPYTLHLELQQNNLPPHIKSASDHSLDIFYHLFNHSEVASDDTHRSVLSQQSFFFSSNSRTTTNSHSPLSSSSSLRSECTLSLHRVSPWRSSKMFRQWKKS